MKSILYYVIFIIHFMHCKEYEQTQGEATLVVQWYAVPQIMTDRACFLIFEQIIELGWFLFCLKLNAFRLINSSLFDVTVHTGWMALCRLHGLFYAKCCLSNVPKKYLLSVRPKILIRPRENCTSFLSPFRNIFFK